MLVLSRKSLQGIRIGTEILITVVKVDRNQVRLGIEAPDHVSIVRQELLSEVEGDKGPKRARGCAGELARA